MTTIDNISKFCIAATVFFIFLNFSLMFVSTLMVFPVASSDLPEGTGEKLENVTGRPSNLFTALLSFDIFTLSTLGVGFIAIVGAVGYGIMQKNWSPCAAAIFGTLFFFSFSRNLETFIDMGLFDNPHVAMILGIIHTVMIILFVGALIYLLKGSE